MIESALIDLVTGSDSDADTLRREQGKGKVLLSKKRLNWTGWPPDELREADYENWKFANASDRAAARAAGEDLVDRMKKDQRVAAFHPKDARISVWEDDPASTQPASPFGRFGKPRPIYLAPPGYADQHRLAVVLFIFSWSMHSGEAIYVLRFDGERWQVIARHFAYYV